MGSLSELQNLSHDSNQAQVCIGRHSAENQTSIYLPFEILAKIFIDCLHPDRLKRLQPDITIAPLLLCRVCCRWRDVAISTPQLWLDSHIRLPYATYTNIGKLIAPEELAFIDRWATNSKPHRPSFRIMKYQTLRKPKVLEHFMSFPDFFASAPIRSARTLELQLSNNDFRAICSSHTPFQNLEYLMMVGSLEDDDTPPYMKFPPTPLLRRLLLDFQCLSLEKITRTLPLGQLTHLCLMWDIDEEEWLELLKQAINLQYGCFKVWALLAPVKKATRPLVHNMRQMTIECNLFEDALTTFEHFVFPELRSFRLATPSDCLTSYPITTDGLHRIFSITPALIEFHIQPRIKVPDSGLNHIRQYYLSTYAPQLKLLMIDKINNKQASLEIIPLLQSNWLNRGWSSTSRVRVEVVLTGPRSFYRFADAIQPIRDYFDRSLNKPSGDDDELEVVLREKEEAHWEYAQLPSKDMRDDWQELMKFYH